MSNLASSVINKFERKIRGKGAVRAGKRFTLFNSNEDMNDIIKIIKLIEDSNVLIDGITETVKHEKKKKKKRKEKKEEGGFLAGSVAFLQ